jgi:hypothetical protein
MSDIYPLTQRQIRCLDKLPEDYQVVSIEDGPPTVQGPRGQLLRVEADGRLVALLETAQSYLHVHG